MRRWIAGGIVLITVVAGTLILIGRDSGSIRAPDAQSTLDLMVSVKTPSGTVQGSAQCGDDPRVGGIFSANKISPVEACDRLANIETSLKEERTCPRAPTIVHVRGTIDGAPVDRRITEGGACATAFSEVTGTWLQSRTPTTKVVTPGKPGTDEPVENLPESAPPKAKKPTFDLSAPADTRAPGDRTASAFADRDKKQSFTKPPSSKAPSNIAPPERLGGSHNILPCDESLEKYPGRQCFEVVEPSP